MYNLFERNIMNEINKQKAIIQKLEEKLVECKEIKMYRIKQENYVVQIPCKHCLDYGEIRHLCVKCGGKGIHRKTKNKWVIAKQLENVENITYDEENGNKYWVDYTTYFTEKSNLLFFTKEEAQKRCIELNNM